MDRQRPEVVTTGRLKHVRVELGVSREFLINDRSDAALGAYLGEEFANGAGA